MDIGTAFSKPFSNITNLIIGIILSIIPFINIITIPGYMLRIANRTMNKKNELPGFDNFGELVVESIKAIVVIIVYVIIYAIISAILGFIPYIGGALVVIWSIIFAFIAIAGMMTLAETKSIGAALNIPEVFGKAKSAKFIVAVIIGAIIAAVIMLIILVIVGAIFGASMLPVIMAAAAGGTVGPEVIMGLMGTLVGVGIIAGVIAIVVGYILDVFFVTIVAESFK